MALLEVANLGIAFGGLQAVDKVDLKLEKGGLHGLIGPNGAGKTTVFNMLTGVYKPTEGDIILDGVNITGKAPEMCIRDRPKRPAALPPRVWYTPRPTCPKRWALWSR